MSFFLCLAYVALTYLRPVEMFAPQLQEYRPMVVMGIMTTMAGAVRALWTGRTAVRPRDFLLLAALMVSIALSQITNGWFGGAVQAFSDFSPSLFLFVLIALNADSLPRIRTILVTIVFSTLTLSLLSIVAFHSGFMADRFVLGQGLSGDLAEESVAVPAQDDSGVVLWRVRSIGFLSDPNDFAQVIVVALPMLALWHRRGRALRNILVILPLSAPLLYTIFLTHSRGALVGMAATLLVGFGRTLGWRRTMLIGILLAVGVVATNATGGRGFSTEEESAGGRILAWSEGLTMLRMRPVFGVGFGNFIEHHNYTAHNSFVLCFAELGLIGYFVWLALVVTAVMDVNQVALLPEEAGSEEARTIAHILVSSMAGFLSTACFLSRTYAPPLFLMLGLCAATWKCARDDEAAAGFVFPRPWGLRTAAILVGSIAIVYVMVVTKHAG